MRLLSAISTLLSISSLSFVQADEVPSKVPNLKTPGLTFLYTVNATLGDSIDVGSTPLANRTIIPITGGSFTGPKLKGTVLNLGADWGVNDINGIFHPDTRYHLRTHDGAEIYIRTEGPAQSDGLIHLNIKFETAHKDYYWLNYIIAVGVLSAPESGKYVVIDAWQLTSPSS